MGPCPHSTVEEYGNKNSFFWIESMIACELERTLQLLLTLLPLNLCDRLTAWTAYLRWTKTIQIDSNTILAYVQELWLPVPRAFPQKQCHYRSQNSSGSILQHNLCLYIQTDRFALLDNTFKQMEVVLIHIDGDFADGIEQFGNTRTMIVMTVR